MKSKTTFIHTRKPRDCNPWALAIIKPKLILASASPRRADLMREAGYKYKVQPSPIAEPEHRPRNIPIPLWPAALAYFKARAVARQIDDPRAIVLGADTIVVLDGKILNKPRDRKHASQMLRQLSGRRHAVLTGLAVLRGESEICGTATSICKVCKLTQAQLGAYLDSGLWQGKAGAYGIQDDHDPFVTLLSGEWSNVVGLPMNLLADLLAAVISTTESSSRSSGPAGRGFFVMSKR